MDIKFEISPIDFNLYKEAYQIQDDSLAQLGLTHIAEESVMDKLKKVKRCPVCDKVFFIGWKEQRTCSRECEKKLKQREESPDLPFGN